MITQPPWVITSLQSVITHSLGVVSSYNTQERERGDEGGEGRVEMVLELEGFLNFIDKDTKSLRMEAERGQAPLA